MSRGVGIVVGVGISSFPLPSSFFHLKLSIFSKKKELFEIKFVTLHPTMASLSPVS